MGLATHIGKSRGAATGDTQPAARTVTGLPSAGQRPQPGGFQAETSVDTMPKTGHGQNISQVTVPLEATFCGPRAETFSQHIDSKAGVSLSAPGHRRHWTPSHDGTHATAQADMSPALAEASSHGGGHALAGQEQPPFQVHTPGSRGHPLLTAVGDSIPPVSLLTWKLHGGATAPGITRDPCSRFLFFSVILPAPRGPRGLHRHQPSHPYSRLQELEAEGAQACPSNKSPFEDTHHHLPLIGQNLVT